MHLSIRVAWHENKWNGSVCQHPSENTFCIHLPRIYEEKDEEFEESLKGTHWSKLKPDQLPPCKAEGGSFMSATGYSRIFNHPYNKPNGRNIPHLALRPTTIEVPPYSVFAVPFWWMLREHQNEVRKIFPDIPKDETPPFPSAWVYSPQTQNVILKRFYEPIKEENSLAIFYVKGPNPVDEDSNRLIAGIGVIKKKSKILEYKTVADYTYPIWDRLITHGIRPDDPKSEGILLPYHKYLELPEDFVLKTDTGKKTKYDLLDEIKLTLQETGSREEIIQEFMFGSKWVNDSSVLMILGKLRSIIEKIKDHGIASGFWDQHLIWIDNQIGQVKESMGPFPAFANALLAIRFQYANSLEEDLRNQKIINTKDNPWEAWEEVIYGKIRLKNISYAADLPHFRDIWLNETTKRKELIQLLSRFELTHKQIKNWFDPVQRTKSGYKVMDEEVLKNPYLIAEEDKGDKEHFPIAVETIDNGLFADKAIQGEFIPKPPQLVDSPLDVRRVRAITINVLRKAAEVSGDTLLSVQEITDTLNNLNLQRATVIPSNYIATNIEFFKLKMEHFATEAIEALQLKLYFDIESYFRKTFLARAKKELEPLNEHWDQLILGTIQASGIQFDDTNERHKSALSDQVEALKQITSRKLSILHGPAGTGKTTVMGALFGCQSLKNEGILLLAPTGKARVRLGKMARSEAFTIAQFLNRQKRFDWERMKPRFSGPAKYQGEQNVIVDECSMLTEEDLYALLQALDLGHIKRMILVGDPYQLPPIGAGRPFADLCAYIEALEEKNDDFTALPCLARLKEVVRNVGGIDSDALTLASWYSGIKPSKNADAIFSKLGNNSLLNDLEVECWENEDQLFSKLNSALIQKLNLKNERDYSTLNSFLGINDGRIQTTSIEGFQLLSPVKGPFWGSFNLNRQFQKQFRTGLKNSVRIGDYKIGLYDKVIQTTNEWKEGFPGNQKFQLSNGQLGLVQSLNKGFANIVFAGIEENVSFGYRSQGQAESDDSNLELAYAITVHKSQGSDFDFVFLIIPKTGRIISRELIYTALTRAKKHLVLLVEGDDPHWIINLSKPQYSETAKRNTHIFQPSIREIKTSIPYAEGLIHKTKKEGLIVRSKSEVIIANLLLEKEIEFEYEREYIGKTGQKRIPDFTFTDPAGDLIILEHLGMMSVPSYRTDWEKKKKFYAENGFNINENLFTTTESSNGAIDSIAIEKVIEKIQTTL